MVPKKRTKRKTLTTYLRKYYNLQEEIALCYRPSIDRGWGNRCCYLDDKYSPKLPYNHRAILSNEIIIEFDDDDKETNLKLSRAVIRRLQEKRMNYSFWYSGNRSYHIHFFINPKKATSLSTLKKAIIRTITAGLEKTPDMQLVGNHLIRAEYGVHEKTGKKKELLYESKEYPKLNEVPEEAWSLYIKNMQSVIKGAMTKNIKDITESEEIKLLLDTSYFNDNIKDGRKRILFVLANVLKGKYEQKELTELLQSWYKYSNGNELTPGQVAYQVQQAYKTDKSPGLRYIRDLIQELQPKNNV